MDKAKRQQQTGRAVSQIYNASGNPLIVPLPAKKPAVKKGQTGNNPPPNTAGSRPSTKDSAATKNSNNDAKNKERGRSRSMIRSMVGSPKGSSQPAATPPPTTPPAHGNNSNGTGLPPAPAKREPVKQLKSILRKRDSSQGPAAPSKSGPRTGSSDQLPTESSTDGQSGESATSANGGDSTAMPKQLRRGSAMRRSASFLLGSSSRSSSANTSEQAASDEAATLKQSVSTQSLHQAGASSHSRLGFRQGDLGATAAGSLSALSAASGSSKLPPSGFISKLSGGAKSYRPSSVPTVHSLMSPSASSQPGQWSAHVVINNSSTSLRGSDQSLNSQSDTAKKAPSEPPDEETCAGCKAVKEGKSLSKLRSRKDREVIIRSEDVLVERDEEWEVEDGLGEPSAAITQPGAAQENASRSETPNKPKRLIKKFFSRQ